ncbi:MAG: hypothetical protein JWM77_3245 [Rhodospirillales bacterium]|jgi:diguanylate cyclase (GGDEF)-like protein|nr:hypothetical protein [Rhodospirillales bacterium]
MFPPSPASAGVHDGPLFAAVPDQERLAAALTIALAAAGDVGYEWDLASDEVRFFGAINELFGADSPPATGRAFHDVIVGQDLSARLAALDAHWTDAGIFDCEFRLLLGDGRYRWVHDRGQAARGPDGAPRLVRGVLRAIDRRKLYELSLEQNANFDELTGLFNRPRLQTSLTETLGQVQRYAAVACYMAIAVDKLPVVGEGFGRAAADAVLIGIAHRLERVLRERDVIGRVGVDMFGVILHRCAPDHMAAVAQKLLQAVRTDAIDTPDGPIHVTLSIGGVALADAVSDANELMAKAELALGNARGRGADCFVEYEWSRAQRREHRVQVEVAEQVLRAFKTNQARFAFQPIVDSAHGGTAYYEALLRIEGPDGSVLPAGAFLPAIDRLGLNRIVDLHVLDLAVAELVAHPDISLAVNVSGLTVSDRPWRHHAEHLLRGRPDVAARLIIEITETVAMQDVAEAERFVTAMRALGCRVALDDFGAGYTSFRHLKALSVDIVKIDGSYVQGLPLNPDNQLFVRTLLALCDGFGLKTVAEFVETQAEADLLRTYGVGLLQGYHCGKPQLDRPWMRDLPPLRAVGD